MRILAHLFLAAALIAPQSVFALDPGKVPPITLGTGSSGDASAVNVTPSPLAPSGTLARSLADQAAAIAGKAPLASPTFTGTMTAPKLSLSDSDSTGDVSGMSSLPKGLPSASLRTFADKLADLPINVNDFRYLFNGSDATAGVQAAINAGLAQNRPVRCDTQYSVSQVIVASAGLRLQGSCSLIGNATVSTPAVLQVQAGVLQIEGSLQVSGNYNTLYDRAVWWKGNTQYSYIGNLSMAGAKLCLELGSDDQPGALISEVTISGGSTYGCTQIMKVSSVYAVVQVISPQWSADKGAASNAYWAGVPYRAIIAQGADVTVHGGEVIMSQIPDGALLDNRPMRNPDTGDTIYSRIRFLGTCIETYSPIAITSNPANLTINSVFGTRGQLSFIGVSGFHNADAAPLITTSADFDGEVIWAYSRSNKGGGRTKPNISAGSTKTDVYVDDMGFSPNFPGPLAGTVGGNVHFSYRQILNANGLNGQSIPAGATTLKYTGVALTGDLGRFSTAYSPATGIFVVPPGGLKGLHLEASVQLTGTGTLYVNRNDGSGATQVAGFPYSNGAAAISYDATDLPAGSQISLLVATSTATTAGTPDFFNTFRIHARN